MSILDKLKLKRENFRKSDWKDIKYKDIKGDIVDERDIFSEKVAEKYKDFLNGLDDVDTLEMAEIGFDLSTVSNLFSNRVKKLFSPYKRENGEKVYFWEELSGEEKAELIEKIPKDLFDGKELDEFFAIRNKDYINKKTYEVSLLIDHISHIIGAREEKKREQKKTA